LLATADEVTEWNWRCCVFARSCRSAWWYFWRPAAVLDPMTDNRRPGSQIDGVR